MFCAILTYQKSLENVEENLNTHSQYLDKTYELGNFIFSGRRNPRVCGVILINQDTEDQVLEIMREDPFYSKVIAKYNLIDVNSSKSADGFKQFIN